MSNWKLWLDDQVETFCKCGCGGVITPRVSHYYNGLPTYLMGHFAKTDRFKKELHCKGNRQSAETRLRHSLSLKGKPKSDNHLSAVLKACSICPNKFETRCMAYLNYLYPGKYVFTGDGSKIVNRRSADAYSEELNTLCLFNGIYWHLKKNGFKIDDTAKGAVELIESLPFLDAGYKVLFIWEDELDKLIEESK